MKSKRYLNKLSGLQKSLTLGIRQELLDQDYLHKLSNSEKIWLSNFMNEYVSADFRHKGKRLHKTKKHIKRVYDANNARNRDAFAVTKCNGMLKILSRSDLGLGDTTQIPSGMSGSRSTVVNELEDSLISAIDHPILKRYS